MAIEEVDYEAPESSKIATEQNSLDSLRLLVAQRSLYSKSKRWMGLRWVGMAAVAIVGPVVGVLFPAVAVVAGAIAGLWIFLGRTSLALYEHRRVDQAASVQELFDFRVFGMPNTGSRSTTPTREEIRILVGDDTSLLRKVDEQKLRGWYPVDQEQSGLVSVAIAQRANASYADRLLQTTLRVWTCVLIGWALAVIAVGLLVRMELSVFMLAVVLPLLPAFLDVWEYRRQLSRAAKDRRDLASVIEERLSSKNVQPQDVLVWQARLFDLRRDSPQVPNFIYKFKRRENEQSMESAARQISDSLKGN